LIISDTSDTPRSSSF